MRNSAGYREGKTEPGSGAVDGLIFPDAGARHWIFENGFELIVKEDPGAPLASLQAWCRTGSIHEGSWLGAGLSHLLEHMLFKGTETRGANEIAQSVQDVGGYFNAYTSFERTVYWIDAPPDGVETALDILADITSNASLPAEEFAREQDVIRREIAMGKDEPDQLLSRLMFSTAYAEHPYRQPVIGHLEIFNQVTRDDLVEYYRQRYAPNNLFFVVTGNVDAEAVHDRLAALFGGRERGIVGSPPVPVEPPQMGRREAHREFATQLSRSSLAWHIPSVTHPDLPALDVLATILGSGRSSRLFAALREEEGLAHAVHAYAYTPAHAGLFAVGGVTDPDKRLPFEKRALEIIADVAREGVSEAELGKARKMVLSDQLHSLTTTRGQAADLGSSWMLTRNLNFTRDYLGKVSRVTTGDVRRVVERYCVDDNLTMTSVDPKGGPVSGPAVLTRPEAPTVQEFTLESGLRLLVREDDRLPLVSFETSFRGGLLAEDDETGGAARLFAKTLPKGSARSSAAEIMSRLEAVGGSLSSGSGRNSFGLSLDVMQPDLDLALDTLAEIFLEATLPEAEIETERAAQLASIKAAEDQPFAVASKLMRRALYPGHPYSRDLLGTRESVESLTGDALCGLRDRLLTCRNGVIAVFGDVEALRVRDSIEKSLAAMPRGELAFEDRKAPAEGSIEASQTFEEHLDKEQAVVMIGYPACNIFHPDRLALELLDEACSDLSSRLFIRIREEMGLAYSVGSSFSYGFDPGGFLVYASTAPDKVDEVRNALEEEVAGLARDGLTGPEFERAKRTFLGKRLMQRQSNAGLAEAMALEELYGLGWRYGEEEKKKIEQFQLGEVNPVIGRFLGDRPAVTVRVMGDQGSG